MPLIRFATAALLVALTAGAPAPALAAEPATAAAEGLVWTVQPSSPKGPTGRNQFDYQSIPGSEIADLVGISNLSRQELTFRVYATDAFTTGDGSYGLLPAADKPIDMGSWVVLDRTEYTVPPGKRMDIPFKLRIPANATPGDHSAGIVASLVERQTTAAGQQVNVDRRVGARMYLRVEGAVTPAVEVEPLDVAYAAPLNPFGGAPLTARFKVTNTGNSRITAGDAKVRVRGPLGVTLGSGRPLTLPELLPGSAVVLESEVTGVWPAGRLTAMITVNPQSAEGNLPVESVSTSTWAAPWMLAGVLLVAAGIWVVLVLIRRGRRKVDSEYEKLVADREKVTV